MSKIAFFFRCDSKQLCGEERSFHIQAISTAFPEEKYIPYTNRFIHGHQGTSYDETTEANAI